MRTLLCLFFWGSIFKVVAQPDRNENIGNKFSFFMVMNMGNAVGNYRTVLKEGNTTRAQFGASSGLLLNPFGRKKRSPIMLGVEYGILSYHDNVITSYPGAFGVNRSSSWLNGLVRYRPILWSSRFNPYIDAFYGVKFIRSFLVGRLQNEEESHLFKKWAVTTPNYGLGVGVGLKLFRSEKNLYLDAGMNYQLTPPTKIVKPNSVLIDNSFGFHSQEAVIPINQLIFKIGLTWFNFRFE